MTSSVVGTIVAFILDWGWMIFGAFGIGGLVLVWIFAPAAMSVIVKAIVTVITELLETRLGCALIAAVIVGIGVNHMRANIDEEKFEQRTAQFQEQQKERDAQIAKDTREMVTAELAKEKDQSRLIDQNVEGFTNALPPAAPTPGANAFLVGNDACKLRDIAGLPPCRSGGVKAVRAARQGAAAAINRARDRLPHPGGEVAGRAPQGTPGH